MPCQIIFNLSKLVLFLLLQESEVTRLQARISSLERAADRQHHTLSLPALHRLTHSPERSSLPRSTPSSPDAPQTTLLPSNPSHLPLLLSPPRTHTGTSPSAHTHLQPIQAPDLPNQTHSWSFADSSLELPSSVKATLREALSKQPWESSSPSISTSVDQSWQGLSALEATAASDLSFNPLTYMVDERTDRNLKATDATSDPGGAHEQTSESRRESVCTLVGQEEEEEEEVDMSTLTGMLRFVNQTLAKQEDPSLWSSTERQEAGRSLPQQVTASCVVSHRG